MKRVDWNTAGAWLHPEELLATARRERKKRIYQELVRRGIVSESPWKFFATAGLVFFLLGHPVLRLPVFAPQIPIAIVAAGTVAGGGGGTYSRTIQTTAGQIPGTLSNYTILVCANGSSPCNASISGLNQSGGGAHVHNSNGYDIVFSSVSDCSSGLLSWEMEKYTASTGEMVAWVLISSLTASTNQFYMCYGSASISTFQGGSTGAAWDSNYKGVWHLPNGSSLSALDSSSNANNGTVNSATATTGQIDGGEAVTGGQEVSIPDNSGLHVDTGDFTISCWWYSTASTNYSAVFDKPGTGQRALTLLIIGTTSVYVGIGNVDATLGSISGYTINAWHRTVLTRTGTSAVLYLDGAVSKSFTSAGVVDSGNALSFGKNTSGGGSNWSGNLDEYGLANSVRSANWVTVDWNNQSAPGSFITFGSEVAL